MSTSEDPFEIYRQRSLEAIAGIKSHIEEELEDRLPKLIGEHTCIYATGSCGRLEMGEGSDLDAYVVRVDGEAIAKQAELEAAVASANEDQGLPPLDGDGKFLKLVNAQKMLDLLGSPDDDDIDTQIFTKRMLLILESQVLVGKSAYDATIDKVIDAYWQNEQLHADDYLPFVLVNDIIRYWRIVLLNHEWKLRGKQMSEDRLLAERRYRSLKLRFPRCLSCFSALTYLLALTPKEPAHVSKENVRQMIDMPPLDRLRGLTKLPDVSPKAGPLVDNLLSLYSEYLEHNNRGKEALVEQLENDLDFPRSLSEDGQQFTKLMFELVQELGGGRPLHRHMVV